MPDIKSIVVKNIKKITLLMVVIILLLSTVIQIFWLQQTNGQNAQRIFEQIGQILDENTKELERIRKEYEARCLNAARTVAYILEYNPEARQDTEELKKIAVGVEVDEIHIFDEKGVIVAGTHPEYYGYSVESGEQIGFFKPLLTDKSLELVQDVTPNTAEGKQVQYSALWSEDGNFIVQVGKDPENVIRVTEKNELSYIFSLLRTGVGYSLYAVDPDTEKVAGTTVASDLNKDITDIGFQAEQLKSERAFYTRADGAMSYCLSKKIGDNYVVWTMPVSGLSRSVIANNLYLLAGLFLISVILVSVVSDTMHRTVIRPIERINENLRSIQDGDLKTRVSVEDNREFSELSAHINSMVSSLLKSSEKLELSEQIKSQKEELERQREQLEMAVERSEAANRAKSEFLFNMSHDIRTPMNAIIGFTKLALESGEPEMQREYLRNIDISSKQLLDLINNILELSRIENRKIMIEENLVNVNEACGNLGTIVESDLKKKNLTYKVKMDIRHPYMYIDKVHYSKIFLNIVNNSIKYTSDGGRINVSIRELPGDTQDTCFLETVIEDNGIGMSQEFLQHAYESFSRERTSTVSGLQGAGLGLAIVKNIVDLMKGTVNIESRQGKGTKVTIRLPHKLGEAPGARKTEEMKLPERTLLFEGKRILLAEDIDINAMIATKILFSKGFIVDRAKDGVECVDMLLKAKAGYYDLVLMDIQMPNMDGYTAARAIRAFEDEKKSSVPIVALTANAFPEDRDKATEAGMNGHLAKPLDAPRMFQVISEVLQKNDEHIIM